MTSKPFEMNKSYYLKAKSYSTSSKIIQKNVISFERKELTSVDQKKIDCFSSHWLLAHSPELPRGLFIRNGNKYTELKSKDYIFISCYAIVEWYFTFSKEISWRGYISPVPLPKTLCGKTMIISTESQPDFQSLEDICCFLEYHQNKKTTLQIEEQKKISVLAKTIKQHINETYSSGESLNTLVEKLRVSRMTFSSCFKKSYGLTPIQYQHRLRIFESLRLINTGVSVTDALFAVGFSDPGQYIDHFKNLLETNPRNYSPKNLLRP